ncbi:MAG TPA: hypothetical protein VIK75_06400, partial [Calditerricola sp.]
VYQKEKQPAFFMVNLLAPSSWGKYCQTTFSTWPQTVQKAFAPTLRWEIDSFVKVKVHRIQGIRTTKKAQLEVRGNFQ